MRSSIQILALRWLVVGDSVGGKQGRLLSIFLLVYMQCVSGVSPVRQLTSQIVDTLLLSYHVEADTKHL